MSTDREDSLNNQYIFRFENDCFSEVITYRKNLIEQIKKHSSVKENIEIQNFSSKGITYAKFNRFVRLAKEVGFTIYKVRIL